MGRWTNLISISRAVQDQRDDQFAFGSAVACDMAWVRLDVGNKFGRLSEECVSTDTACFGGRNVDELTSWFAAEWAEEEDVRVEQDVIRRGLVVRIGEVGRMNVEAFTNGLATRTRLAGESCLPHQFTALSPDPKRGKARSELYIRDAALARFET